MTHSASIRTVLLGLVIALALAACSSGPGSSPAGPQPPEPSQPTQPTDPGPFSWADVLGEYRVAEAVYAIGVYLPDGRAFVIGTGFAAYYSNALWTNAHVAIGLRDELVAAAHLNPIPFVVQSGTVIGSEGTYAIIDFDIHPEYDGTTSSPDVASIDIAIDGELPVLLELLPREFLTDLEIGEPIATMGFPGEIANPYRAAPIATFKDGVVSALRPFDPADTNISPENTTFVQHNLDLSGGTSGSPIIDRFGLVIAVNNAGTDSVVFDERTGQPTRIPSGNIGFGIRADEVWTMIDLFESSLSSNKHRAPVAPATLVE